MAEGTTKAKTRIGIKIRNCEGCIIFSMEKTRDISPEIAQMPKKHKRG